MLFAGFNVHEGEYPLWAAVARRLGGEPRRLVDRLRRRLLTAVSTCSRSTAKFLHIKPSHLAWADRWFERYGAPAVFFSRMLPIIRTFISLPAGVARMPFWKFTRAHARGLRAVDLHADLHRPAGGRQLEDWKDSLHYVDYAVAVVHRPRHRLLAVRWWRNRIAGAPRMRRPSGALELRHAVALGRAPRARPSCCPSPPRPTRRSCRGCSAGPTPSSTPSCARPSRSRCTPGTAAALLRRPARRGGGGRARASTRRRAG